MASADSLQAKLQARAAEYTSLIQKEADHTALQTEFHVDHIEEETGSLALSALKNLFHVLTTYNFGLDYQNEAPPLLGARDLRILKTLLSILCNWKFLPTIVAYDVAFFDARGDFPSSTSTNQKSRFHEIPDDTTLVQTKQAGLLKLQHAYRDISETVEMISEVFAAKEQHGEIARFTDVLVDNSAPYILALAMRLAWGPEKMEGSSILRPAPASAKAAELTSSLLKGQSTLRCLQTLSGSSQITINAEKSHSPVPPFIKAITERLFSAQLLRKDGVLALLRYTLSETDANERGLMSKLSSVGHLLSTPPTGMPVQAFIRTTFPNILEVFGRLPSSYDTLSDGPSQHSTLSQRNAASFALARQAEVDLGTFQDQMRYHIYNFITPPHNSSSEEDQVALHGSQVVRALQLLYEISEHAEPSSDFSTMILEPVAVPLFVIDTVVEGGGRKSATRIIDIDNKTKEGDPTQACHLASTLLRTWLRLSSMDKIMQILHPSKKGLFALSVLKKGALCTDPDRDGRVPVLFLHDNVFDVRWMSSSQQSVLDASFSRLSLSDWQPHLDRGPEEESAESLLSAIQLMPSPNELTSLLHKSERSDVAAVLLTSILEAYTLSKQSTPRGDGEVDTSMLSVVYIQHILQLIKVFGADLIKDQPDKILAFVAFALGDRKRPSNTSSNENPPSEAAPDDIPFIGAPRDTRPQLPDLFNLGTTLDEQMNTDEGGADEDEDEELVETALSLLLSLLERRSDMTFDTHGMLFVIARQINNRTSSSSSEIRSLAREVKLVLTARKSALTVPEQMYDDVPHSSQQQAKRKGREMYQEALRLLQDPILPVRAHGIITLKELVAHGSDARDGEKEILLDPALVPAILDIFIQSVCDDDSYLYLNAVKGLAELGNMGGRTMISRLMALYLGTSQESKLSQQEVDKRLRVGEALLQIIQRLEDALGSRVTDIVPPILAAVRQNELSATLRASMLSILGTCIEANPFVMAANGYSGQIAEAMLDLLIVEVDKKASTTQEQMDDPLEMNTKLPQLRRAALLLLILLVRGSTEQLQRLQESQHEEMWKDDTPSLERLRMPGGSALPEVNPKGARLSSVSHTPLLFPSKLADRTKIIVNHLVSFDTDGLARHQATQLLEDLDTLTLSRLHASVSV